MKKFIIWKIVTICLLLSNDLIGQEKYTIKLKTGDFIPEVINLSREWKTITGNQDSYKSYYHAIVQFDEIPSRENRKILESKNVHFGDYLPHYAYLMKIDSKVPLSDLDGYDIRSITFLKPEQKISPLLLKEKLPEWAVKEEGFVDILVAYDKDQPKSEILSALIKERGKQIPIPGEMAGSIAIQIERARIPAISTLPFVYHIEPYQTETSSLLASSVPHSRGRFLQHSSVMGLSGAGVTVGVADQVTTSNVTEHVDLKNRVSSYGSYNLTKHSTGVSGVLAGKANIRNRMTGYAPNAEIILDAGSNFYDNIGDYVLNESMPVANHSYHNYAYGGVYNGMSTVVDQHSIQNPTLLNVYAIGNEGDDTEPNGYTNGFNTCWGGGNTAKNTLSVGGVNSSENLASFSSKGPTIDGRLKPEIVAESPVATTVLSNGYQTLYGTSFAAPAISGGVALLVEYYRKMSATYSNPKAGLIKTILCNTTDDLGNPGPDFSHGFGRMNLRRAFNSLLNNTYIENEGVAQNETDNHTIIVPVGAKELNVTLYWVDEAGSISSSIVLVNNLDLTLEHNGTTHYPWVLDPSITGVENNAIKAVDNLNNIEKITILDPSPGTWNINVKGEIIPNSLSTQEYFIAYEIKTPEIVLTHPMGGESFEPGQPLYITWDGVGDFTSYDIEFSTDEGNTWSYVDNGQASPLSQYHVRWSGSNLPHGKVVIRVTGNGTTGSNSAEVISMPINIMAEPDLTYSLGPNCQTQLNWGMVSGAEFYEVYKLGFTEMELIGTTTDTDFLDPLPNPTECVWYSVRAVNSTLDIRSDRAFAIEVCSPSPQLNAAQLNIKVMLEGPYISSNSMGLQLNNQGLLPNEQPYSDAPWYYMGDETMSTGTTTTDFVDWVLVSFRTSPSYTTEIARTAALVQSDGSIYFPNDCTIPANYNNSLHIVIQHRNHLSIISPIAVNVNSGILTYDFRSQNSFSNAVISGQKEVEAGVWAMYTGDLDGSESIDVTDQIIAWDERNTSGYLRSDCSMDGNTNAVDRGKVWINKDKTADLNP